MTKMIRNTMLAVAAVLIYVTACMEVVPTWAIIFAVIFCSCSFFFATAEVERERLNSEIYEKRLRSKRLAAKKWNEK